MRSVELLAGLEQIPLRAEHGRYTWAQVVERSAQMRNDLFAIEIGAGIEGTLSALFDARNVPDDLHEAYRLTFPSVATDDNLYERFTEMIERGPENVTGFVNNLKGKLFELRLPEHLQHDFPGYSFNIAASQNQPLWDIIGVSPDGTDQMLIQAKIGGANYAGDVLERMQGDPDVLFAVSNEIRTEILNQHPDLANQFVNLDLSNYEFASSVENNLNVLAENFGIDVPDEVGDILPYVTEIILGIKFLCDIIRVERDFKAVKIDDRGRVHAMKTLVLFTRFGISAACTAVGGAIGTSIVPGFGTATGAIGGATLSAHLNKKLNPRMMEIAMWLMRVTEDDLFYFRNKVAIDRIGGSLAEMAIALQS